MLFFYSFLFFLSLTQRKFTKVVTISKEESTKILAGNSSFVLFWLCSKGQATINSDSTSFFSGSREVPTLSCNDSYFCCHRHCSYCRCQMNNYLEVTQRHTSFQCRRVPHNTLYQLSHHQCQVYSFPNGGLYPSG